MPRPAITIISLRVIAAVFFLIAGMAPGVHTVGWNAADLPGGVYFCILRSGPRSQSMQMLLIK